MHSLHPLRIASALLLVILAAACSQPSTETPAESGARSPSPPAPATAAPTTPASPAPVPAAEEAPALAVEAEGLRLFNVASGAATPLSFGLDQAQVFSTLEGFRGAAAQSTNEECGAGPVQVASWPDGLSLVFQGGKFVGWGASANAASGVSTAIGIGPGSTRTEVTDAYGKVEMRETTLGTEFSAGELHGLLDGSSPDAKIAFLWAGVSCMAR